MWECKKCSKPVYFAERKQSLGFDWHPNCLRCEECGKRLNPGQHAEHKGVPFCHHPCYGALFGPQLFGHGTRNECHTSFGKVSNRDGHIKRSHLETQLKIYNNFYESKHGELKSREVNGRLVLEGALRVYWGVKNPIHLKEEDDSRMIAVRRRSCSGRENYQAYTCHSDSEDNDPLWRDDDQSFNKRISAPENLTISLDNTSEIADSTLNESEVQTEQNSSQLENESTNFEMNHSSESMSNLVNGHGNHNPPDLNGGSGEGTPKDVDLVVDRNGNRSRSTAIRRRPGRRMVKTKLKRRCSINGHFYLRETSSFIPPFGSSCSIWISSKTSPEEVLNRLLEKYKVEMSVSNFALFVVKDNGELRRIKAEESPLVTRVMLGPCEDVAKVFIMDVQTTREVSHEAAQFLNLSLAECRSILVRYEEEELKNIEAIKNKYKLLRALIEKRIREDRIKNNVS